MLYVSYFAAVEGRCDAHALLVKDYAQLGELADHVVEGGAVSGEEEVVHDDGHDEGDLAGEVAGALPVAFADALAVSIAVACTVPLVASSASTSATVGAAVLIVVSANPAATL